MATPTNLQLALDAYSLAVQQYGKVADRLPAAMRPVPLDRFKHRGNIFAIKRRTEEVAKATARLRKAARGPQLLAGTSAGTDGKETSPETSNAKSTAAEPVKKTSDANPAAGNAGSAHAVVEPVVHSPKPTRHRGGDPDSARERHTVGVQAPDRVWPPDAQIAEENRASPSDDRTQLFTYDEVQLLIRIASSSPNAAGICARRIGEMKSHGAGLEDIKDVLQTVIRWVDGGGSANGREGGRNTEDGA
ncbi:hypothetical protein FN846DRAFT_912199 [Sphaerosporella brunnea]|uniref:Uncharacterized protein n=1 Tax=Sphaerosporella brunnea TaxID=1250544 RepID=A0A5J5EIS8_9PEZI|nr:hypothetical protein FN846DRAFT_912199 [Sphaerosporella brunnea]